MTSAAKSQHALEVLRSAVAEALDRKRRLGHYAVFWKDGKVVRVEAEDLPSLDPADPSQRVD